MPTKAFEHTVPFYTFRTDDGEVTFPIVIVDLLQDGGNRVSLPLLFDTGASVTTLRRDRFPLLGLQSWDSGELTHTHRRLADKMLSGPIATTQQSSSWAR